jgi:hypothetical protein
MLNRYPSFRYRVCLHEFSGLSRSHAHKSIYNRRIPLSRDGELTYGWAHPSRRSNIEIALMEEIAAADGKVAYSLTLVCRVPQRRTALPYSSASQIDGGENLAARLSPRPGAIDTACFDNWVFSCCVAASGSRVGFWPGFALLWRRVLWCEASSRVNMVVAQWSPSENCGR